MPDPVVLLYNPAAGGGRASRELLARWRAVFGGEAATLATPAPGSNGAVLLAALRALPPRAVLCIAGGDGTLHLAVNALDAALRAGRWPRLAHVPTGSANDGARALAELTGRAHARDDLDGELRAIAARVTSGHEGHAADLGVVTTASGLRRLFANFAAALSPADWAALSARPALARLKRWSTRAAYELCNVAVIARRRVRTLRVGLDGAAPMPRRLFAWFAARARYLGGGIDLGEAVRLDSGKLHVVAIEAASRVALVRLLQGAKHGRPPAQQAVASAQLEGVELLNLDGEVVPAAASHSVTFGVLQRHVRWL